MTQRIFDIENEKDMADLLDILPDDAITIRKCIIGFQITTTPYEHWKNECIKINWHDKTEIHRPIREATKADIGKLCRFWNDKDEEFFGRLGHIGDKYFTMIAPVYEDLEFFHCRRLTKQEIEELC